MTHPRQALIDLLTTHFGGRLDEVVNAVRVTRVATDRPRTAAALARLIGDVMSPPEVRALLLVAVERLADQEPTP